MSIKMAEGKVGLMWCDPPSGWKYGFPKAVDKNSLNDDESYTKILLEAGYPEEDIHLALKYSRFWAYSKEDDK